ncbi:MAG: flavin reductase family protein [Alphaproteobacteria bacterium]|nr:flavin reductase family protein [Alphaproteobacteria bacterium]
MINNPTGTATTEAFFGAMRRLAAGVAVVTTHGSAGKAGLTVSSLSSLTADPPAVLVCVARDATAAPLILQNRRIGVSLLADHQTRVSDVFAGRYPDLEHDRFQVADWMDIGGGQPVAVGALACLDCRVDAVHDYATHHILVAPVEHALVVDVAENPLIYALQSYQKLGGAA